MKELHKLRGVHREVASLEEAAFATSSAPDQYFQKVTAACLRYKAQLRAQRAAERTTVSGAAQTSQGEGHGMLCERQQSGLVHGRDAGTAVSRESQVPTQQRHQFVLQQLLQRQQSAPDSSNSQVVHSPQCSCTACSMNRGVSAGGGPGAGLLITVPPLETCDPELLGADEAISPLSVEGGAVAAHAPRGTLVARNVTSVVLSEPSLGKAMFVSRAGQTHIASPRGATHCPASWELDPPLPSPRWPGCSGRPQAIDSLPADSKLMVPSSRLTSMPLHRSSDTAAGYVTSPSSQYDVAGVTSTTLQRIDSAPPQLCSPWLHPHATNPLAPGCAPQTRAMQPAMPQLARGIAPVEPNSIAQDQPCTLAMSLHGNGQKLSLSPTSNTCDPELDAAQAGAAPLMPLWLLAQHPGRDPMALLHDVLPDLISPYHDEDQPRGWRAGVFEARSPSCPAHAAISHDSASPPGGSTPNPGLHNQPPTTSQVNAGHDHTSGSVAPSALPWPMPDAAPSGPAQALSQQATSSLPANMTHPVKVSSSLAAWLHNAMPAPYSTRLPSVQAPQVPALMKCLSGHAYPPDAYASSFAGQLEDTDAYAPPSWGSSQPSPHPAVGTEASAAQAADDGSPVPLVGMARVPQNQDQPMQANQATTLSRRRPRPNGEDQTAYAAPLHLSTPLPVAARQPTGSPHQVRGAARLSDTNQVGCLFVARGWVS
ncbi:hypothetical protein V8C86DRAFT_794883 [Haematococcus lacustris]